MSSSLAEPGLPLAILCIVMISLAALAYRVSSIGRTVTVPAAAIRGSLQLAAVSVILAAALESLWTSLVVLAVMLVVVLVVLVLVMLVCA